VTRINKVRMTAFLGLMLAIVIVLSVLESMLPQIPLLPPNFRIGLSNIVTMYCAIFISKTQAVTLNALKSVFVLMTRGPVAGLLSFCGGMLSILILILLLYAFKDRISYIALSCAGAVAHNLGQFIALLFILDMGLFVYYLPFSLIAGILMGLLTGALLRFILPALERIARPFGR